MTRPGNEAALWLRFAAVSLAWGSSFLLIKLALEGLGVYQVAVSRNALGAATLLLLLVSTRTRLPLGWRVVGHSTVVAATLNAIPALLYAWAETRLNSGLAGIYNATTPLMTLLVGLVAFRAERVTGRRVVALGVGFAGVAVVAAPSVGAGGPWWAHAACLGATACYGIAYVYIRKFLVVPGADPLGQTALQLVLASLLLLPGAFVWVSGPIAWTPPALLGVVLLGVVGTGLCFVWNSRLIAAWGPSRAAMTTYITPAVGVLLGALVLREPLHWSLLAGLLLVLASVVLGRDRPPAAVGDSGPPVAIEAPEPAGAGARPASQMAGSWSGAPSRGA